MSSEDGFHLRDEAGSLLAAFELELGGAEELTVTSGGTAMAALDCRQSHTSSTNDHLLTFLRLLQSLFLDARSQVGLVRAFAAVEFTRAACDSFAQHQTRLGLSPAKGVVLHPSTHTCHHQLTTRAHILSHTTRTLLSLTDTPYRHTATLDKFYLINTTSPFFRGIDLCPLSGDIGRRIRQNSQFMELGLLDPRDFF